MDYSYWNFSALDCQFRHCGPLNPHVGYPFAPIIQRPMPLGLPLEFRDQKKNAPVMRVIMRIINHGIDCPIEVIRMINYLHISQRKKALYYKVLYQETPSIHTLGQMYTNYYLHRDIPIHLYSNIERKFVYKCNYSDIPSRELYKWEYLKNTARY